MGNELAKTEKASLSQQLADKFGMDSRMFLSTIKATVMPSKASNEEVAAFLMVAKEYDLNPILREIHAFPKKGGGIQTVVGVDGWAKIISRHQNYNGADFAYEDKDGKPFSCTCTLHRKDCEHPTVVTEYFDECHRNTEPWNTMPRRMLRHKAFMQAGRYGFGISGIMDQDEANDIREVSVVVEDDPLAPGRHNTRRQKAEPEADIEMTAEAPQTAPNAPEACDGYDELHRRYESDAEAVLAVLGALGVSEWAELDPMDRATVSSALAALKS